MVCAATRGSVVRSADSPAFSDAVVRRYSWLVWAVAAPPLSSSAQDREDVFQEVWLAYLRSADRIKDPRALAAWLIRVARRIRNRCRERAVAREARARVDPDRIAVPFVDPVEARQRAAAERWRGGLAHAVVETLEEPDRTIWELRYLRDPPATWKEVSLATGLSAGAVRTRNWRCLKKLRPLFEELGLEPGS